MNGILQDVRFAFRQLWKNPGFTTATVLLLSLGLGACTGMLAVVQSILVRPLNYPHSEQLVLMGTSGQPKDMNSSVSFADFEDMQRSLFSLQQVAIYGSMFAPVETSDGTQMLAVPAVSTNFFELLGIAPTLGRGFRSSDSYAAVVSHGFWLHSMAGNRNVLGSKLKVNGELYTVVGVMPEGFQFPVHDATLWTTLQLNSEQKTKQGFDRFSLLGRIKSGVSIEQATKEGEAYWKHKRPAGSSEEEHFWLHPYQKIVTGDEKPALMALLGACFVLLMIALVNVANLQLARATTRDNEIAVRGALGGNRLRLMRPLMLESLLISLLGAAVAWYLASGFLKLASALFTGYARIDELRLDPWSFGACLSLAILCGVAAALAPSWYVLRRKRGLLVRYTVSNGKSQQRLSAAMVVAEVALTCVLLVAAGLFLRTFRSLQNVPLGFVPDRVTTFLLWPQNAGSDATVIADYQRVLDRLSHLRDVDAAGAVTSLPISNFQMEVSGGFSIPGHVKQEKNGPQVRILATTPGYLGALQVPLLAGRFLTQIDVPGTQVAGVVNQTFVAKYLRGVDPIGQQILVDKEEGFASAITIVGVCGDVIQGNGIGAPVRPELLVSYQQLPASGFLTHFLAGISGSFAVRSRTASLDSVAREIRTVVAQEAPELAIDKLTPLRHAVSDNLKTRRTAAEIAGAFAWISLFLASAGLYGVLAYLTEQRIREIGVRMALGATKWNVCELVLRQGSWMVLSGLLAGWLAAVIAGRWIKSFLFATSTHDLKTYASVALLMVIAAAVAMFFPARRAAKVDPMVALRYE